MTMAVSFDTAHSMMIGAGDVVRTFQVVEVIGRLLLSVMNDSVSYNVG